MTLSNATPPETPVPDGAAQGVIVHVVGRTDVGRTREHNEDAFVIADLTTQRTTLHSEEMTHRCGDRGSLFMVADGMGGAAAGEIASQMAVDIVVRELASEWQGASEQDATAFARALKRATAAANAEIHAFAVAHPEYRGMGTTATIAGLLEDTLYVAQVGDSRAYLVRDGTARQITKDQSLIQRLVDAGEITEEEARVSERRNIILQAIGPEANIKIDLTHQQVRRGDMLVLCSDGLSGLVMPEEIGPIVAAASDLSDACTRLIDTANERGGPDNITVIVARFDGARLSRASSADVVGHRVYPAAETGQMPAMTDEASKETTAEIPTSAIPRRRTEPVAMPAGDAAAVAPASAAGAPMAERPAPLDGAAGIPSPAADARLAERRKRGMLIMGILLLAMLAGAAWFAYDFITERVVPAKTPTAQPAPATSPSATPPASGT